MSRPGTASNRPQSAVSRRSAWDNDENRSPSRSASRQEGYDEDMTPMDDELYNSSMSVDSRQPVVHVAENQNGCWDKFKRAVRSLWATRQTEDTGEDREMHVKTTLRELVVYLVFLVILCVVTFGMTSPTMYYYTQVMSQLFLDTPSGGGGVTFRGLTTMSDFWTFSENALLDGLYWETWYNQRNVSQDELGYIFYENKRLGVPRIRQLKVRNDSCTVHDDFKKEIKACYDAYAESIEDKEPFGKKNGSAYTYHTEKELGGSGHWGLISRYAGGGFYQDLETSKAPSAAIISDLKSNLWLDRGTRAVFIDFTVYNANINLFCVIRLVVEFPATGGAIPQWVFRTVKLIRYVTVGDYFVMACEGIFVLFILYYMIEEGIEIKKHKMSYFKSFWNILDILVIIISIVCIAFNVYRTMAVGKKLDELLANPNMFPDFEFLSYWQVQFNSAIAITVFMAWVKVFKYISFNKTMTQLSSTLAACAKDLAGFAVMFFIIFLAFAQLGYLIFGTQVKDFSAFDDAVFTLFRIILGDFNFQELEEANRILGPIYFLLYVFFVFFVLLNMFLAIINDTYSEVKAELANQKSEFEMGDYFKKGYDRMLDKLAFKRDKIVDIQKAINSADRNQDKHLDFDEWRQDLKTRGYAEAEIEAVFAKYDVDGDRVLDESEQAQMTSDLEGQKRQLNKERDDLEDQRDEDGARMMGGGGGVSFEEFNVLVRRVDRMEHSIGSIVSKIDAVLVKLEAMERAKAKRRETMSKILDSITESDGASDEAKREQMEQLVRRELDRWDTDANLKVGGSGGATGGKPPSRPGSSAPSGSNSEV